MPVTLDNFTGLETGGLEEASATTGSPSIQNTTVRSGTYALSLAGAVTPATYRLPIAASFSGTTCILGLGYRTTTVIPTNDTDFMHFLTSATTFFDDSAHSSLLHR